MAFRIRTVKGEQVRDNGTQTVRWDTGRAEWVVYCRERRRHFRGFLSVGNAQDFCDGKSRRVILVSCAASKLDRPAPATDLYTSPLFRAARSYAEASGHPWYVLSARIEADMTQEQLAYSAGLDRAYVSQLNDHKSPTVDTLLRLCRALGTAASAILARVEREHPSDKSAKQPRPPASSAHPGGKKRSRKKIGE